MFSKKQHRTAKFLDLDIFHYMVEKLTKLINYVMTLLNGS